MFEEMEKSQLEWRQWQWWQDEECMQRKTKWASHSNRKIEMKWNESFLDDRPSDKLSSFWVIPFGTITLRLMLFLSLWLSLTISNELSTIPLIRVDIKSFQLSLARLLILTPRFLGKRSIYAFHSLVFYIMHSSAAFLLVSRGTAAISFFEDPVVFTLRIYKHKYCSFL